MTLNKFILKNDIQILIQNQKFDNETIVFHTSQKKPFNHWCYMY